MICRCYCAHFLQQSVGDDDDDDAMTRMLLRHVRGLPSGPVAAVLRRIILPVAAIFFFFFSVLGTYCQTKVLSEE